MSDLFITRFHFLWLLVQWASKLCPFQMSFFRGWGGGGVQIHFKPHSNSICTLKYDNSFKETYISMFYCHFIKWVKYRLSWLVVFDDRRCARPTERRALAVFIFVWYIDDTIERQEMHNILCFNCYVRSSQGLYIIKKLLEIICRCFFGRRRRIIA